VSEPARGRLFQDEAWVFRDLVGCTVERFVASLNDAGAAPLIFFLKPSGGFWQRFFFDAGLGFWSEAGDEEVAAELEGEPAVDYGERFGIVRAPYFRPAG
jgi:hypothetical protein